MPTAKIGEWRIYEGPTAAVIYPGEQVTVVVDLGPAIAAALERGETGPVRVEAQQWIVEPIPGVRGWYLRTRYRLIGRPLEWLVTWWRSTP